MPSPDMLQEAVTDINDPFFLGVYRLLAYLDEDRVLIAPNAPFQFRVVHSSDVATRIICEKTPSKFHWK